MGAHPPLIGVAKRTCITTD